MTWFPLFTDQNTAIILSHAIMLTFAFLFSLFCLKWAMGTNKTIGLGKQADSTQTLLVFIGGAIFSIYCLASACYFFIFRYYHYSWLLMAAGNVKEWDRVAGLTTPFMDYNNTSRRIMWWVSFFTLICSLCFAFCAYAAWSVFWNRFVFFRYLLHVCCLGVILFGFLTIFWAIRAKAYSDILGNLNYPENYIHMLFIVAIICIVIFF